MDPVSSGLSVPRLPDSLRLAIAEAKQPQHATCGAVRDKAAPMLDLVTTARRQIAEHEARLFAVEVAAPETNGHTERLHQTLRALEKDAQAVKDATRRLMQGFEQYERYATEIEKEYVP
jgi:hypothetical protein